MRTTGTTARQRSFCRWHLPGGRIRSAHHLATRRPDPPSVLSDCLTARGGMDLAPILDSSRVPQSDPRLVASRRRPCTTRPLCILFPSWARRAAPGSTPHMRPWLWQSTGCEIALDRRWARSSLQVKCAAHINSSALALHGSRWFFIIKLFNSVLVCSLILRIWRYIILALVVYLLCHVWFHYLISNW